MSLPYDIFRLISLYLPPEYLSVNGELRSMYNDGWFHDKLQVCNPDDKLYTSTNYRDLYRKYLREGNIYEFKFYSDPKLLPIRGIKATYTYRLKDHIKRPGEFSGNLI